MRHLVYLTMIALLGLWGCKGESDANGEATEAVADDGTPTPAAERPIPTGPSVLLITLDTTRADRLGCYGNPHGATPNLDRIAAEGALFRRAFCHTPLTIPSHATILTGQYPDRHGIRDNGDHFLGDAAVTVAERFHAAGYDTAASVSAYVTNHKWGFGQGFEAYFDHIPANYEVKANVWQSERRAEAAVEDLDGWLAQDHERPFFAWLHLFDPHHPYAPPPPYDEEYAKRPYLGEIAYMDAQIGELLAKLEERGQLANTAILVAGDHGESFGAHDEHQHGIFVYNATMHVPFILRPAGGTEAKVVEGPVGLVDVAPTLLAMAGLPADDGETFDGVDLSPALEGTEPARRSLYGESLYVRYHFGWSEQRMLVDWPLKYVGSTQPQLFDIQADPTETQDLIAERGEDAARLAGLLEARPQIETGRAAADIDPETARRLEALGYVAERVEVPEGAVLPDPKDKTDLLGRFAMARAAMHENKYAKARQLLAKVVEEEPELVDPRLTLAQVQLRTGDVDKALAQIDEADRLSPGSTRILELRATALAMTGRTDDALTAVEQALVVDDQQARTWGLLLQVLFESRRYDAVVAAADRADAVLPGMPSVAGYRGSALSALGRFEEARPQIDAALAHGATPPWAHSAAGILATMDGDLELALTHYLAEHSAYPEHIEALYAAVLTMSQLGRNEDVLEYATMALTADPQAPDMHRAIGQAQFNQHEYETCHDTARTCLQIDPEHPDCMMLLANVLKKLGRDAEAEEAYTQAVDLARERLPGADVQGVKKTP